MRNTLLAYIDRFRHDRRQRAMLGSVLLVLAVIVTLLVYWQLRLSGIAMTNETYCGYEEHVHTDECYEYTLICELEETGHVHDESCYEEQQVLVCGLEETEGHTHSESCYDEEGNLVCGLEEFEGHTHSEACYETQTVLICGQEETPDAHVHTDECYEKTLICELEEHTHTVECLIDLTADVEDETIWSATIPELTGDLRTDIVAIANSQVGYTESTANYSLGEDGITHYGYTRYGAWYGSEYADWDSIFAAFCLDYAGIADEFSYNAGSFAWTVDLANLGYYQSADSYVPSAGDLVFVDTDLDGRADKTAVVVSVDNVFSTVTAIQGNYTVTDADGNSTDAVAYVTYSMTATAAPVLATISEDGETVDDVVPVILGYANVTYAVETTDEEAAEEEATEEVADEEEIDLDGETDEEITDEEIADETTEPEVVGSAAVLTYAGEDYTITVTYGEDALIPEGTYLVAYEYSSDSETYLQRYAESAAIYGWEGEPTEDFRVFNIGLYYDGVEIEPAAEIQVSITYTAAENSDSVSVTHHGETAEPLYAVSEYSEETGTETVTFTTDGFSDYSVMLASTGAEENNGLTATSSNLEDVATVSWSYTGATYDDGSFYIDFRIDFTGLSVDTITSDNYTLYLTLPDGVTIPSNLVGYTFDGHDKSGKVAFTYSFVQVGDTWQVVLVFDESYVSSATGTLVDGYVTFEGLYSLQDKNDGETTEINIYSGDTVVITIDGDDVTTDDDENWLGDISVEKSSASGYSTSTNSITYTVVISSKNGTQNSISLTDAIDFANNNSNFGTLSVKSITIDSVKYYTDYYNSSYYTGNSKDVSVTNTSTDGVSITLDALSGTSTSVNSNTQGDCYVITYTVYFNTPESGDYNTSISNSATATSDTDAGEIKDSSEVTKNAVGSSVTKTGDYDADTNTITWTITYNATGANIAGKILYDYQVDGTSFADATTGLDINNSGTYEYVYDTNGTDIIGIKFLAVEDTDGDGTADSNTNTYTITYTTEASAYLGSSSYTARNIVTVDNVTAYGNETVGTGGKLSKILSDSASTTKTDGTTTTRDLTWTSTVTIPVGGIKDGSYLVDYLGTSGKDYSSYTSTDTTDQWFTYSQITTLFSYLATNGLQIVGSSGTTVLSYGTDFTLYAYDATSGAWVAYGDIADNGDVYTAYQIYFLKDNDNCAGTLTLTYSTTADISDVEDNSVASETYYNSVKIGSLEAYASYTEQNTVYKTDGDNHNDDTDVTVDEDGELTWIVHLYIQANSTETYTVTDNLPAGLTFESAKVTINWDSATLSDDDSDGKMSANFGWITPTAIEGTVTGNSTNGTTITIDVLYDHYSQIVASGGYITITYTATIDGLADLIADVTSGTTVTIGSYDNNVTVYYGTTKYGDDSQEQDVSYTKTDEGDTSTTDHDVVEKSGVYSSGDATLRYEVLLNLDGEELNAGSNLTFTDIIKTYYYNSSGIEVSLQSSSVTFYQLYKIDYDESADTGTYTDSNGVTQTITSLSSNIYSSSSPTNTVYRYVEDETTPTYSYYYMEAVSIPWTYTAEDDGWGNYTHTITATIPDKTSILVIYKYDVSTSYSEGAWFSITNNAYLTGENTTTETDKTESGGQWSEEKTSGGIVSGSGITIYKVEPNNYSATVSGAKFEFYMYDTTAGKWVQITQDKFLTGTDTTDSTKTVSNPSDDTMTSDNYLVTEDGVINISSTFTYDDGSGTAAYAYYSWYQTDTLYYIVEVEAPSGYELLNKEKVYFYWSSDNGTLTYPSDVDQYNTKIYDLNATSLNPTVYIENQPNTSFTLVKVSTTDTSVRLSGATYALYEFHGNADTKAEDGTWTRIGTYVTDENGEITITYNDAIYDFNHAYKLVEVESPEGYNIGYNDMETTTFYFYWSSPDTADYPTVLPSDWASGSTGTSPSEAIDISTQSASVQATNTKTTTTVAVKKLWVNESGTDVSDSSYKTTVQLYYYVLPLDSNGNPIRTIDVSTAAQITITTAEPNTTATLFSKSLSTTIVAGDWTYGFMGGDVPNMISALSNSDYNDIYLEFVIQGGSSPSSVTLKLQRATDYNTIGSVSPTNVELVTTANAGVYYYHLQYSLSAIEAALESGYSLSDVVAIALDTSSITDAGTIISVNVCAGADYAVPSATVDKILDDGTSGSTYIGAYYTSDSAASALQEDGATIAITYSNATSGSVLVGVELNSTNYYKAVTVSDTSGTIYVLVSDLGIPDSVDWSSYVQVYAQYNQWSSPIFTGTIDSISILIPSTSSTTATYAVVASATSCDTYNAGTENLTSDWTTYLTGNDSVRAALTVDGAMIYIEYDCTSVPSQATLGIQYTSNSYGDNESISIVTDYSAGSGTIAIPVSSILSGNYDTDDYNAIFLNVGSNDSGKVTIKSVSVIIPYIADAGVAPVNSTSVILYNPSTGYTRDLAKGDYEYNYISKYEDEPGYTAGEIISDKDSTVFTGYGFLDAIYSDVATTVSIMLENVLIDGSAPSTTDLKRLALVIQGDISVGGEGYGEICTVSPYDVVANSDGSYTLYYSTSTMTDTLNSKGYASASDACADYNGVALQLEIGGSTLSATISDLRVTGTVTDYYAEEALEGESSYYTSTLYSDDVYTLDSTNNWSVAIAGLPLSYTVGDTEYAYFYYFLETADDSYTGVDLNNYNLYTTYSQSQGENGGGEIVIVNTLVETTSAKVEKVWVDQAGNVVTDTNTAVQISDVKVALYYYLVEDTSGTSNGTIGTYSLSDLVGENTTSYRYGTSTYQLTANNNWTLTIEGLPKYTVVGTTKYLRYYYFVEESTTVSTVSPSNATYSQKEGVLNSDTTITITNVVTDEAVGYRLPSTDGTGGRIYIFIGLTLMVLALLGCAYRNIHRIRFSAVSNDTLVRKPAKPGTPNEEKCLRHQKKLSKDRNGDSRAGPKS
ncbi:MAG: hypothetical protein LIO49_08855 [Ruminococcus sp.]|nr:hypothetical protein [Ruminococcus sp.]